MRSHTINLTETQLQLVEDKLRDHLTFGDWQPGDPKVCGIPECWDAIAHWGTLAAILEATTKFKKKE